MINELVEASKHPIMMILEEKQVKKENNNKKKKHMYIYIYIHIYNKYADIIM
jgi:hypothetical protein